MKNQILRNEVLKQMDTGDAFDLVFITADKKRGTGGDLITVKGWRKVTGKPVEATTPGQVQKKETHVAHMPRMRNNTIKIFNPYAPGVHPITVHIRLMQFFNGSRILNG